MESRCRGRHVRRIDAGPFRVTETVHPRGLALPRHEHPFACLHFVLEGVYRERIRKEDHAVGPGAILLKPADEPHHNRFDGTGARTLRLELAPDAMSGAAWQPPAPLQVTHPELERLALRIRGELGLADDCSPLAVDGLARELLALVLRRQQRLGADLSTRAVERCERILRERFAGPIRLGAVAAGLGVRPAGLARAFRAIHGCTMGQYVRGRRVAHAAGLLRRSDLSLGEIALASGFSDQSHLTRVFRRHLGVTPGAWRKGVERRAPS